MQPSSSRKLALRGLALTVLLGCLWFAADLRVARSDEPVCDAYDEYVCTTSGYYMNEDCTCNYLACINGRVPADCQEQGLEFVGCTCVNYNMYCQDFDAVIRCIQRGGFLNETTCSCTPSSAAQLPCSNEQNLFCNSWAGSLDNRTCLCRFAPSPGSGCTASQDLIDACESMSGGGGTWDDDLCFCRIPL